jgi:hypothetical protein
MLEYAGKWENDKLTLERVIKDSIITGNKHKAEKLATWAYQAMYHNAERVNKTEITLNEGWKNHLSICHECTSFGLQRGEAFEKQEYLSLLQL